MDGRDKTLKQRVRSIRFALKLRVELAGNKKGMIFKLDHLDEVAVR
jgi:hypothetical protein